MNIRGVALSLAVFVATALVPAAQAQRQFAFARSGNRTGPSSSRRSGMPPPFVHQRRARGRSPGSLYWPYFYSDYDYDYGYDSEPQIVETPPPQIIEQVAQRAPVPVAPVPDSVVIELQGDHWVRVTNYGQSQVDGQSGRPESARAANSESVARRTEAAEPIREVPAAVLVFRDGHREEIGKYVVVGATLYANSDYWASGSWTRKVQLSALDVPATLKLNQDRDTKFTLPSGPTEVMVRP